MFNSKYLHNNADLTTIEESTHSHHKAVFSKSNTPLKLSR